VEVEYNLTPEDLQAFLQFQRQKGPKTRLGLSWPWLVLLGLLLFMAVFSGGKDLVPGLVLGGVFGALGMLLVFVRLKLVTVNSPGEYARDQRNQWVFATQRVALSPEEFTESSWFARGAVRWEVIWDIAVTADHVFFCTTTQSAHAVPRRAFRDQQHFDEFVALARRYKGGAPTLTATGITAGPFRPTTITRAPE
jgi:hypothetical protein